MTLQIRFPHTNNLFVKLNKMQEGKTIKMNDNPLQPNDIGNLELEMENDEEQELTRFRKCRILCSRESIVVTVVVAFLGGLNFILNLMFVGSFSKNAWVFFALGIISCLLVLSFIARTCIAIQPQKKEADDKSEKEGKKPPKIVVLFGTMKTRYNHFFDVNGKYYLTKMYTAELLEHTQQAYSLTTVYLCLMPVEISSVVSAVLTIELLVNICATFRIDSREIRDRLILLDIFTDMFCLMFPLFYTYASFTIPVTATQILLIVTYPILSLCSKLNDIWGDYFKMDLERIKQTKKQQKSARFRRRKSILNLSHNHGTLEMQLRHFPKCLRCVFIMINISFVLFFVSLISVHLATQPSTDKCSDIFTNEVWGGCRAKVPFCQDLFVAKCDCTVLEIANYTHKKLPESFGGLKSLTKLAVYSGQLEELPQPLGDNHKRMIVLMVVGNRLQSLPDSIGNLHNLLYLRAFNNQLKSLPDSVGNLQNLLNLRISNNRIKSFPESLGNLQNLHYFFAWNNTLTTLPKTVGDMKSLINLDVRHNRLTDLPLLVGQWSNIEYLYLAGNPLCADLEIPSNLEGAKGLCEQQCSVDCPSVWLGDGECDDDNYAYRVAQASSLPINAKPKPNSGCNTAACEYDKGDCPQ